MKDFIIQKWLWEEYCVLFTEKRLEKSAENRRLAYTPKRASREEKKERAEKVIKLRNEWKTWREIWIELDISHELARIIYISSTK
jgi:hypothetical protein